MSGDVVVIDGRRILPACPNCRHWDRLQHCDDGSMAYGWRHCDRWEYRDWQTDILAARAARDERIKAERRRGKWRQI